MTVQEIHGRVESIRAHADDNERAHADEDDLWRDVLRAIAAGHPEPQQLAEAAVKSTEIEFTRWHS